MSDTFTLIRKPEERKFVGRNVLNHERKKLGMIPFYAILEEKKTFTARYYFLIQLQACVALEITAVHNKE